MPVGDHDIQIEVTDEGRNAGSSTKNERDDD
jgi:hypothetical protein